MLSVWNKVNKRMMQRLKTDPDAPYQKLYLTSTDISDAPTQFPCLYIKSLGEPTSGKDFRIRSAILHPRLNYTHIRQHRPMDRRQKQERSWMRQGM